MNDGGCRGSDDNGDDGEDVVWDRGGVRHSKCENGEEAKEREVNAEPKYNASVDVFLSLLAFCRPVASSKYFCSLAGEEKHDE